MSQSSRHNTIYYAHVASFLTACRCNRRNGAKPVTEFCAILASENI
jgi:hypothetical protein